jgi:ferric-dicitrate binding protein FerR (iron transport regulator)
MNDSQREELARRLLEQAPASWPEELRALRMDLRAMPEGLRSKLAAMHGQKESRASFKTKVIRWPVAAAVSFSGAIAAALVVYFGVFRVDVPPMRIVFSDGDTRKEGQPVKTGALGEHERITVGDASSLVLGSADKKTEIGLRVRANSELTLPVLQADLVEARLVRGVVLSQLSRKDSPGRALLISTHNAQTRVTGTVFSVDVSRSSDTLLSTFEGTVSIRRRWSDLEDLPENLLQRSEILSRSRDVFLKASASVPAGSQAVVSGMDFERRLGAIPHLRKILSDPRISALRGRLKVSDSEVETAKKIIESNFPGPGEREENLRLVETAFGQPPEVTVVPAEDLSAMRQFLEQPSEAERKVRYEALLKQNPAPDRETFRRTATQALGKAPQEILLKNGETLFGSVFGLEGKYQVYTAQGIRVLDQGEVEEIRFE